MRDGGGSGLRFSLILTVLNRFGRYLACYGLRKVVRGNPFPSILYVVDFMTIEIGLCCIVKLLLLD